MEFFLTDWAVWMPVADQDNPGISAVKAPELPQVPAMTRRRLSRLTKMTFDVALKVCPQPGPISTIFASRHGDLSKTLGLLEQIARQEVLSPTQFALSVHNAIVGQLSLFSQNTADTNAVASGADSLHYAVLEAAARLQTDDNVQQILVLYADEPVPDIYQSFCQDPAQPVALALLLSRAEGEKVYFERQPVDGQIAAEQQVAQLLPWLQHECQSTAINGRHCQWLWARG